MKSSKILAPLAAAAALAFVPMAAQAGLMIQITDGTNTLDIADGSALDGIAEVGGVCYSGSFGGWTVTAGFGASASDPLSMHLSAVVMGDRSDGKVWIKFTHTDLDAATDPMSFTTFGGGAGAYGSVASWAAYVDDSNVAFGTDQTIFSSNGYTTAGGSQSVALNGAYSATLATSFDYTGISNGYLHGSSLGFSQGFRSSFQGSSLDLNLSVPEPASLALLGLGLVGIGATRRRRA